MDSAPGADGDILLDEIICEIPEKYIQWRVTINIFRGVEYLHFRKYFMDMDGEFIPSKEGACLPVDLQRLSNIVSALFKVLSDAEALNAVLEHLDEDTIKRLSETIERKGRPSV